MRKYFKKDVSAFKNKNTGTTPHTHTVGSKTSENQQTLTPTTLKNDIETYGET